MNSPTGCELMQTGGACGCSIKHCTLWQCSILSCHHVLRLVVKSHLWQSRQSVVMQAGQLRMASLLGKPWGWWRCDLNAAAGRFLLLYLRKKTKDDMITCEKQHLVLIRCFLDKQMQLHVSALLSPFCIHPGLVSVVLIRVIQQLIVSRYSPSSLPLASRAACR